MKGESEARRWERWEEWERWEWKLKICKRLKERTWFAARDKPVIIAREMSKKKSQKFFEETAERDI